MFGWTRPTAWFLGAIALVSALATGVLGLTYVFRLCEHTGHYLVPVADSVGVTAPRPRRAVFVLVDGLSLAHASELASVRRLRAFGQCRRMTTGPVTSSRPMYALLSTGLEQARTGCRSNSDDSPLAAESVWQVARRAGLRVTVVSALPWWTELFPAGFDRAVTPADVLAPAPGRVTASPGRYDEVEGYFAHVPLTDLTLLHPLSVDDAGHEAGARSPEYASAVARVDRELGALLDRLDLGRDLLVVTSDHGHRPRGGHGGPQPEVATVLTCFAGHGVTREAHLGRLDARSVAPALALLLGLPFPAHLHASPAGEDGLDDLFTLADPSVFPAEYLAERRAAVERFRAANRERLAQWLDEPETPPSWSALYAREASSRRTRLSLAAAVLAALAFGISKRRRVGWRGAIAFFAWAAFIVGASLGLYAAARGSLDLSSINGRWRFIATAALATLVPGLVATALHAWAFRDRRRLVEDWTSLVVLLAALSLLEPFVHGWKVGVPLPGPTTLFLPLFAPVLVSVCALIACALCLREARGAR